MRGDRGFTLLEVLVALVVLGLLLAALGGMMRFTLGAVAQQTDRDDVYAEAAPVRERIAALIGDARPVAATPGGPILFEGSAQSLILVAPLDIGGLQLIRIGLADGGLMLRWSPYDALAPAGAGGSVVLLPRLAGLQLHYLGAGWQDTWQGKTRLPKLVRISWHAAGRSETAELVVAPRVTSK